MTEEIQAILESDIIVSKKPGAFSTPTEIQNHLNQKLDSAYSTKAIAESLKLLGWKVSGKKRVKRQGKACNFYYRQGDIHSKALLSPNANSNDHSETQSNENSSEGESLSSINKRFRSAQADKEKSLSKTRETESKSATHRERHLELQLQKERRELISVEKVSRYWNEAIMYMRNSLYELPMKFSDRWASEVDGGIIHDELIKELDIMCRKWSEQGEKVISQDEDEDI